MLQIDFFVVLAQAVNFGILFYIFKHFIADKMNERIAQRKKDLEKLKKADEHYEQKMALAAQQKEEMVQAARETTSALMKESEIIAREKAAAIIVKAKQDALAVLESGKRELEKERLSMLSHMKSHIVDVSLKLNEKMFGTQKLNREFLEKEVEQIN